jgi:hypothetical protein
MKFIGAMLAALLATTAAQAAEEQFDMKQELASDYLQETLVPGIKLYLGNETTPAFAELTRPDIYTSTSVSLSPFGGSRRHCLDALQKSLRSLASDAKLRGYEAVVDIRPVLDGKPAADASGFKCKPGYKVTTVAVSGAFAMSEAALAKANEAEAASLNLPTRKAAEGAIFLPAQAIITSDKAKAALGPKLSLHWGAQAPAYSFRYGPDEYEDSAEITKAGAESACHDAVVKVLRAIAEEALSKNYDAIIKLRSRLHGAYAPGTEDIECQVDKKAARVTLQATLAQKK